MVIFDPVDTWKKTKVLGGTYELRELLVPVIKDGKSVYKSPSVMELRDTATGARTHCGMNPDVSLIRRRFM